MQVPLVRKTGLEPTQYCYHKNLNLARLPIPPFPHMPSRYERITDDSIHCKFSKG